MPTVRELLDSTLPIRPSEVQIAAGYLIVTPQLIVLFPSENDRQSGVIITAPDLVEMWRSQIPMYAGTRVLFAGEATVRAKFAVSGVTPLPVIAIDVERIEISSHGHLAIYEPKR